MEIEIAEWWPDILSNELNLLRNMTFLQWLKQRKKRKLQK